MRTHNLKKLVHWLFQTFSYYFFSLRKFRLKIRNVFFIIDKINNDFFKRLNNQTEDLFTHGIFFTEF